MQHGAVAPDKRGTFAGLATPDVVSYIGDLGVSAVELLPIQGFLDEWSLVRAGLRDLWGYNPITFFAPERRYLSSGRADEFKAMVRALHDAGIEVLLDVVYTIRPKATIPDRRCAFAVSTTPPTTGCMLTSRAITTTSPAVGTASTFTIRGFCSSSWIRCDTGCKPCMSTASDSI